MFNTPPDRNRSFKFLLKETVFQSSKTFGILLTVVGTVLLDFDADACQSPARAYMLDVTIPGLTQRSLVV